MARRARNFFGIKATRATPKEETYLTSDGELYRRYRTERAAFESYGYLMSQSTHYASAREAALKMFVREMAPIYCPPDPDYRVKILHLIEMLDDFA